jgi:hypothetical protein
MEFRYVAPCGFSLRVKTVVQILHGNIRWIKKLTLAVGGGVPVGARLLRLHAGNLRVPGRPNRLKENIINRYYQRYIG